MASYDNHEMFLDDITVGGRLEGSGKKLLVFLHGLGAHSGTWRKNVPYFSANRLVWAPSVPLHDMERAKDLRRWANIVVRCTMLLNCDVVAYVGNSAGGMLASICALLAAPRTRCIILEDTAPEESYPPHGLEDPPFKGLYSQLGETGVPTMVVWGRKDQVVPVEDAEKVCHATRCRTLKIFEDASHVPHWEKPWDFNQVVDAFLESVNM
ncbi:MAG: alpha/beta hydrolase [Thermoprotei archaeon]